MGPYFFTMLVHLLGPAKNVRSRGIKVKENRNIDAGPRKDEKVLVEVPTKIYSELRQIFVFLFENSGFKDVKINETVDFKKLYKLRKVQ